MNPVTVVRNLIAPSPISNGTVLGIEGTTMRVQSSTGIITVQRGISTDLTIGDNVTVIDGVIVSRQRRESNVPIYYL